MEKKFNEAKCCSCGFKTNCSAFAESGLCFHSIYREMKVYKNGDRWYENK